MTKRYVLLALTLVSLSALVLTSCKPSTLTQAPVKQPTEESTPISTPTESISEKDHRTLPIEKGAFFSTSGTCIVCHTNMVDESGEDVSNGTYWRSTMMANAGRDPYWLATVRSEVLKTPAYQAEIEDKCISCHMPMAHTTDTVAGKKSQILDNGYLDPENENHILAIDGVSCSVCHQIQPDGFGEKAGFSGNYSMDMETPSGERTIFGPYQIGKAQANIMKSVSGFVPKQGLHIQQSELCATCHTLYTSSINAAGEIVGEFPEQTPYLEWLHSEYKDSKSCQDCHMPTAQGGVQLSVTGGPSRSPFSKHVFVGGNIYILKVMEAFGDEMDVTATNEQFETTIARTLEQLQNQTASLTLGDVAISDSSLTAKITVENQAGHKFPAGYPSRRAWLHITLTDSTGKVIFESGRPTPDGAITGNDQDADPEQYEPHYTQIDSPDQVQIYETVMHDPDGNATTTLMRATGYIKDNRLLPVGFDKETAPEDIAVQGNAQNDQDFLGGGDAVEIVIDLGDAKGPFTLTVELLYQSISYRWINNLRSLDAPEINHFMSYQTAVPNEPVLIDSLITEITK